MYSATKHGHHADVACQPSPLPVVTQAERVSKIAQAFRTTDQNDGKIRTKIGLIMDNIVHGLTGVNV